MTSESAPVGLPGNVDKVSGLDNMGKLSMETTVTSILQKLTYAHSLSENSKRNDIVSTSLPNSSNAKVIDMTRDSSMNHLFSAIQEMSRRANASKSPLHQSVKEDSKSENQKWKPDDIADAFPSPKKLKLNDHHLHNSTTALRKHKKGYESTLLPPKHKKVKSPNRKTLHDRNGIDVRERNPYAPAIEEFELDKNSAYSFCVFF